MYLFLFVRAAAAVLAVSVWIKCFFLLRPFYLNRVSEAGRGKRSSIFKRSCSYWEPVLQRKCSPSFALRVCVQTACIQQLHKEMVRLFGVEAPGPRPHPAPLGPFAVVFGHFCKTLDRVQWQQLSHAVRTFLKVWLSEISAPGSCVVVQAVGSVVAVDKMVTANFRSATGRMGANLCSQVVSGFRLPPTHVGGTFGCPHIFGQAVESFHVSRGQVGTRWLGSRGSFQPTSVWREIFNNRSLK